MNAEKFKSRLPKRAGSAIDVNAARRAQTRVASSIDPSAARRARARAVIASTINSTLPRKVRQKDTQLVTHHVNASNNIINNNLNLNLAPPSPPNAEIDLSLPCNSNEPFNDENLSGNTMTNLKADVKVSEIEIVKSFSLPPDVTDQFEFTTNGFTTTTTTTNDETAKLTTGKTWMMKTGANNITTSATPAYVAQDECDTTGTNAPSQPVPTGNLIAVTPNSNVKSGASNGLSTTTMNGKTDKRNGQNVIDLLTQSPADPAAVSSSSTTASLTTTADSLKYCNKVINPVIDQLSSSATTLKMLTKLIEKQTSNVVMELLPKLMPKLVEAYDSPDIAVRKGAVFAMVAIYKSVGEASIAPYLTSLTVSKMKLLKLYIGRSGPVSNTSHSNNSNSTSQNQSSTHPAPAQVPPPSPPPPPSSSSVPLSSTTLCPGNNDTNDH